MNRRATPMHHKLLPRSLNFTAVTRIGTSQKHPYFHYLKLKQNDYRSSTWWKRRASWHGQLDSAIPSWSFGETKGGSQKGLDVETIVIRTRWETRCFNQSIHISGWEWEKPVWPQQSERKLKRNEAGGMGAAPHRVLGWTGLCEHSCLRRVPLLKTALLHIKG